MAAMPRSAAEQFVMDRFLLGDYRAFGCCANPTCEDRDAVLLLSGRNPSSRICVTCFEFDFNCTFPNLRGARK